MPRECGSRDHDQDLYEKTQIVRRVGTLETQNFGQRGKTVARSRLNAPIVSPSPGGEGRPVLRSSTATEDGGEGGRFGSLRFHDRPRPRRGVRSSETGSARGSARDS